MFYDTAADLLAAVSNALTAAGLALPARAYVSDGNVAFDGCETLAVEVENVRRGAPGNPGPIEAHAYAETTVELACWLLRCVSTVDDYGNPPDTATLASSGAAVLADLAVLWDVIPLGVAAGTLWGVCREAVVAECRAVGPEGGMAGWVLRAQVSL